MRRIMFVFAIVVGMLLLSISAADACGDKSLRIGRGVRFLRTAHPATVLIYLPFNPPAASAARAAKLQALLEDVVGHKAQTVQGVDVLGQTLHSRKWDVVVTDLAEAASVQGQIESSSTQAALVAVVSRGTKAEVAAAQKQYRRIVRNPNSADQYREAIEEVMRARVRVLQKKV